MHVGRRAVGAQDDEIVEILVRERHAPLHVVLDDRLALARRLDADDRSDPGGRLRRVAVAPAPVIAREAARRLGLLPHRRELLGRLVGVIGLAAAHELLGHLAMPRGAGELEERLAVPIEPEPGEPVEDRRDRRLGRALAVGILDAEQHLAARVLRIEPVEQGRARPADMEEAGGRGGETRDDGGGHGNANLSRIAAPVSPSRGGRSAARYVYCERGGRVLHMSYEDDYVRCPSLSRADIEAESRARGISKIRCGARAPAARASTARMPIRWRRSAI